VNRRDPIDLQNALLDVPDQVRRVRLHRGPRAEHVGLDQELLLWKNGPSAAESVRSVPGVRAAIQWRLRD
jgi:hypothetical protein